MNTLTEGTVSDISINQYVYLCLLLFTIGMIGVLIRRNIIVLIMCIELMLNAVNLILVAFSKFYSDTHGQVFVFFIMAVAAAEVAVGLAVLVVAYQNLKTTDIRVFNKLKW